MLNRRTIASLAATLLLAATTTACGAAQAMAKSQLASQCSSTGLHGCPELADGAMAYVAGEKAEAEVKLKAAAAANSPEQVKKFAKSVEPIINALDGDTARSLREVMAILTGSEAMVPADDATALLARADAAEKAATRAVGSRSGPSERRSFQTGMAIPATDDRAAACGSSESDARCRRTRLIQGPFVVTNLYASGGCPDELALFAASNVTRPRWSLLALSNERVNVAGHFVVEEGEALYASARTAVDFRQDARCGLVWSGYRGEAP